MWLVYAVVAAATWGLNYVLDEKVLKSQISPFTLLAFQSWAGALIFTGLSYAFRLKEDVSLLLTSRPASRLMLASLITALVGNFFIVMSIQAKNATFAALVEESYPIFTILFSFILFKENHLSPTIIIGGIFILLGVAIVSLAK